MDPRRHFDRRWERFALYWAEGGACARCGRPLDDRWHADHVKPWSRGGATRIFNGQALCERCNLTKGARDG